jgi:hypothetical protein
MSNLYAELEIMAAILEEFAKRPNLNEYLEGEHNQAETDAKELRSLLSRFPREEGLKNKEELKEILEEAKKRALEINGYSAADKINEAIVLLSKSPQTNAELMEKIARMVMGDRDDLADCRVVARRILAILKGEGK